MLEKARVVAQQKGERNFHIFYQLLSSEKIRDLYSLKKEAHHYHYLNKSGCYEIEGVSDEARFKATEEAMRSIGFDE